MTLQLNSELGGVPNLPFSVYGGVVIVAEMFRVNSRISHQANAWLDKRSEEVGVSKSALIMLAVENYMQQTEVMHRMADMGQLVAAIERLESKVASDK